MKFNANTIGAIIYPTIFFAIVLTIFVILPLTAKAEHEGPGTNDVMPEFTDPQFPFPREGMFRMPALIDCGDPKYVKKILADFKEIPVGTGQTFVIRPDGLMQPAPFTFYANPETRTTSVVVKFVPPFGPGIWCIISAGAEFQPAGPKGDNT
ncbi:MAG: hypothetical protein CMC78_03730 [Flavobacteriaceae bacterium]|nr:hypothetical protein [Flavobacteriaceae bacterium]|tara:strand:- start:2371 stop:2826 length:456 start_codon:yes stop_codon:yes gene_type:complete